MQGVYRLNNGDKPPDDAVYVALTARHALVKVEGRGSFKIGASLKQFAESAIKNRVPLFLMDMSRCIGMDSTFMGLTAGIASRMKNQSGRVVMINCSSRTRGLLATLGLDQLITAHETADTPAEYNAILQGRSLGEALEPSTPESVDTMKTILAAHEQLVKIAPENLPQFKDVLTYLREEVARKTNNRQGA
jgi:anti-anti-sigma regulatory factor